MAKPLLNTDMKRRKEIDEFKIAVSVDCVIFGYEQKTLKVLVIKSDIGKFKGMWALPGDLVRPDEDLDDAPYRVLQERTGLTDVYLEQVHSFGAVDRHPMARVITVAFHSLVDIKSHRLQIQQNEASWLAIEDLKTMAFDHKLILETSLNVLREQINDHPIVYNLLPEKFSLRELQDLYEAIMGMPLDRRNFRKRITLKNWLVDLNEMEDDVPHRPGKLYKFKTQLKKTYSVTRKTRLTKGSVK